MSEADNFLKNETENDFTIPEALMANPGDPIYSSLIKRLNEALNSEQPV